MWSSLKKRVTGGKAVWQKRRAAFGGRRDVERGMMIRL
jgi:hypothetical protein